MQSTSQLVSGFASGNTEPAKRSYKTAASRTLAHGFDSLYFTVKGKIFPLIGVHLDDLKRVAASDDQDEESQAQIEIPTRNGQVCFMVDRAGRAKFRYFIENENMSLKVSSGKGFMPMAVVQFFSAALATRSLDYLVNEMNDVLAFLGEAEGVTLNRADLYCDMMVETPQRVNPDDVICRAKERDFPYYGSRPTGIKAGYGGDIVFRWYDKTQHIAQGAADHAVKVWEANGYDHSTYVFRAEFQLRTEALRQFECTHLQALIHKRADVWQYLTHDWIRVAAVGARVRDKDRAATRPWWKAIQKSHKARSRIVRLRPKHQRQPQEKTLAQLTMGALSSVMALRQTTNYKDGWRLLRQITDGHYEEKYDCVTAATDLAHLKAKQKARLYCTMNNLRPSAAGMH